MWLLFQSPKIGLNSKLNAYLICVCAHKRTELYFNSHLIGHLFPQFSTLGNLFSDNFNFRVGFAQFNVEQFIWMVLKIGRYNTPFYVMSLLFVTLALKVLTFEQQIN